MKRERERKRKKRRKLFRQMEYKRNFGISIEQFFLLD
jgi:hypothetical protein